MLMGTARRSDELEQSLCETRSRKGTLLYVNELSVLCLSCSSAEQSTRPTLDLRVRVRVALKCIVLALWLIYVLGSKLDL